MSEAAMPEALAWVGDEQPMAKYGDCFLSIDRIGNAAYRIGMTPLVAYYGSVEEAKIAIAHVLKADLSEKQAYILELERRVAELQSELARYREAGVGGSLIEKWRDQASFMAGESTQNVGVRTSNEVLNLDKLAAALSTELVKRAK